MRKASVRLGSLRSAVLVLGVSSVAAGLILSVSSLSGAHAMRQGASSAPQDAAVRVPGACCLDDGKCEVHDQGMCLQLSGTYMGDASVCEPFSCITTPTHDLTWGKLKAGYRSTASTRLP